MNPLKAIGALLKTAGQPPSDLRLLRTKNLKLYKKNIFFPITVWEPSSRDPFCTLGLKAKMLIFGTKFTLPKIHRY